MIISKATEKKNLIFFSITILFFAFSMYAELNAVNSLLPTLSFLLFILIFYSNIYLNKNDYLSPMTVFSIMYSGYFFGGFYYSYSSVSFGKFIDFTNLSHDEIVRFLRYGLLLSIFSYAFFVLGYILVTTKKIFFRKKNTNFLFFFGKYYLYLVVPLLFFGAVHWLNVAHQTAGNVFYLFLYFQAFPHLAEDAGISTLPYHLYYSGIFIWLLGLTINDKQINIIFIVFSVIGMLINLTQGRITLAVTFILAQLFFIGLLNCNLRLKIIYSSASLIVLAFFIYFARMISNSLYIGADFNIGELDFLKVIIGSGNVADLQQLVIIFSTFDINNSLLGITYFDWLRNTFGGYFGYPPSSVGLIIKEIYVPETSGAPTPGAIGEAYANFNILAPLLFIFVGYIFAFIYKKVMTSGNVFLLFLYSLFLARFVFVYPKVDSTMLSNFFWGAAPTMLFIIIFYFYYLIAKHSRPPSVERN